MDKLLDALMSTALYAVLFVLALLVFILAFIMLLTHGGSKNRHKYGPENFTQAGVLARIEADFPKEHQSRARELLERMGPLGETHAWVGQAQFAALLIAQGNLDKLSEASDLRVQGDTRDIIIKAGIG